MNMKPTDFTALALAAFLLSGAFLLSVYPVAAQSSAAPGTTATRPAQAPAGQTSIPNASPPVMPTRTTGEVSRDPAINK
jgi:hypothetical protein